MKRQRRSAAAWVAAGVVGLLAVALVAACGEDLLAPGSGTCPAFCPPERVTVIDSLLTDNISGDSSFVGYVLSSEAGGLEVLSDSAAPVLRESRALIRFFTFPDSVVLTSTDTTTGPVVQVDSFSIQVPVTYRLEAQTGLELLVYRLPAAVDTAASFADLDPYFADSTRIAVIEIPDTLVTGDVSARLDSSAFPTFHQDGNRAAVGLALRAPDGAFAILGSVDANDGVILTRYMEIDSAGTTVPRSDAKLPAFDTFVAPLPSLPGPDVLRVGGSPSARALLRVQLPPRIADSSTIVRATLVLLPVMPTFGAPGDSLRIIASGVGVDVGAKSPVLGQPTDSLARLIATLAPGSTDTVRLDITTLVVAWARDSTRPRTLSLRAIPEGSSFAELWFGSSASATQRPLLDVTFVPPITLGGR